MYDIWYVGLARTVYYFLIVYYTVLYPYNTYYPLIPYVSEKWSPTESNEKGVIVQLLKSWTCVPNLVVPKNESLGGYASQSEHIHV